MQTGKLIHARRRAQQIKDNARENISRTNYIYMTGDMIRIITTVKDRRGKLIGFEHPGPYKVTQAHNNGTIIIRCRNFLERIRCKGEQQQQQQQQQQRCVDEVAAKKK